VGPVGKAVSRFGTWAACITVDCKNVDAAERFIKYFCTDTGLKVIARATSLPLKKYNNDKEIHRLNPTIAPSASSLEAAQERPMIRENQQYIPIVGNAINAVVAGKDAKTALDEACSEIFNLLQDAGYYK
jgi:ABC-type glycerol-3-phosphate transport system substrate-binding protein